MQKKAAERGLIIRVILDRIACTPPLIITEAQIDEIFQALNGAMDEVWDEVNDRTVVSMAGE